MSWNKRWMDMAKLVASWSKDRSRHAGAVIVGKRNVLISVGWNGFPREIDDDMDCRHERPAKYAWTEHAERNAVYNAAANGHPTLGATMYIQWYPCADCCRAIIQSGIQLLVCIEPDWNDKVWANDFAVAKEMLHESGVAVTFYVEE